MIASDAIETSCLQCGTSKEVSAPNNQSHLNTNTDQLSYLQCHLVEYLWIDAKGLIAR